MLDFWKSISSFAPDGDDHTSMGRFWGKEWPNMPRLWLHCLLAQTVLCLMGTSVSAAVHLGGCFNNPVEVAGKQKSGFDVGDQLQLKYKAA